MPLNCVLNRLFSRPRHCDPGRREPSPPRLASSRGRAWPQLDQEELLCDFHAIEQQVDGVIALFHNANLNKGSAPFDQRTSPPTIAEHVYQTLVDRMPQGASLHRVEIGEALGCTAVLASRWTNDPEESTVLSWVRRFSGSTVLAAQRRADGIHDVLDGLVCCRRTAPEPRTLILDHPPATACGTTPTPPGCLLRSSVLAASPTLLQARTLPGLHRPSSKAGTSLITGPSRQGKAPEPMVVK